MDPAMYIFINEGLGMSAGKVGAQAAHAAVEAFRISANQDLLDQWYLGKHYKKLIMAARDVEHLRTIERYLEDRGFDTELIIDEGMTEIPPHTATALGVEIVDKDDPHTRATFSTFSLLRDKKTVKPEPEKERTWLHRLISRREKSTTDQNPA